MKFGAGSCVILGVALCGSVGANDEFTGAPESVLFQDIPSVYGASKYDQSVLDAPSSITVVTAEEIARYGYRHLADVLGATRGFYTRYDRTYHYAGVRGFSRPGDYNTRLLLAIDGRAINDNLYGSAGVADDIPVDIDTIERIEIIRGPSSSLYGTGAFFGVINIVTKRGRDIQGAEVATEYETPNARKVRVSVGGKSPDRGEALLSYSRMDRKGKRLYFPEYDDPATNNGVTEGTDYQRNETATAKLSWGDFAVHGGLTKRTKGTPTGAFFTDFNDSRNQVTDDRYYLDLRYEHDLAQGNVSGRLFYDWYDYDGDYIYGGVPNHDYGYGRWWGAELKWVQRLGRHRVTAGGEYRNNSRENLGNFDPTVVYMDVRHQSVVWAGYMQDEVTLGRDWLFNAGVRYDHYETFGGTTNPRLALIYRPSRDAAWKLLYGQAFRTPNSFEIYAQSNTTKMNLDLQPETIKTTELVYERYWGRSMRAAVTAFDYDIENLINRELDASDGLLVFRNGPGIRAQGIEFEVDRDLVGNLRGFVSYAYQHSEDTLTGTRLSNSPRNVAVVRLLMPVPRIGINASWETRYNSERLTVAGETVSGFHVSNLVLTNTASAMAGLDITFGIYNVFDKEYAHPGSAEHLQSSIMQDGRSYRLKFAYKF